VVGGRYIFTYPPIKRRRQWCSIAQIQAAATMGEEGEEARNLYNEVRGPMGIAFFMFLLADIREMALAGELTESSPETIRKLTDLPIDGYEFLTLYKENKEAIQKKIESKERYEMYASIFAVPEGVDDDTARMYLRSKEMIHCDDLNSEEECVFGVIINHINKRVTVAFRGSVTPKDFVQDAKALFTPIPNPVEIVEDADHTIDPLLLRRSVPDKLMVHLGFREYLYGETSPLYMPEFIKKVHKASRQQFEMVTKTSESVIRSASETLINTSTGTIRKASDTFMPGFAKGKEKDAEGATTEEESTLGKMKSYAGSFVPGFMTRKKDDNEELLKEPSMDIEEGLEVEQGLEAADVDVDVDSTPKKKYEVILDMVSAILKENPGYVLQICGHSLGGALATMFAFEAAAANDELIPKPVFCVTSGAPKVGNLDFLHAFEVRSPGAFSVIE